MSTQTFRGRNAQEAREAAIATLGRDAVIVATRHVPRASLGGLFGARDVEVTAAREPKEPPSSPTSAPRTLPFSAEAYRNDAPTPQGDLSELRAELRREIRSIRSALAKPTTVDMPELTRDLSSMRELLEELAEQSTPTPKRGDAAGKLLRDRGIEGPLAVTLTRALKGRTLDAKAAPAALRKAIAAHLAVAPWPLAGEGPTLIGLVGPWGVGKTTTAAKLAARAILEGGKSVTLIAADAHRVGAVDQLRRWAEILEATFAVARTGDDVERIVAGARTDVVIVDTAGHGPGRGAESFLAQRRIEGRSRHVLLCLPAALRAADAARVARTYVPLAPTALAITKLDDTELPAGLAHAAYATHLPISTLCDGQRVPEDIAAATEARIFDALVPMAAPEESPAPVVVAKETPKPTTDEARDPRQRGIPFLTTTHATDDSATRNRR